MFIEQMKNTIYIITLLCFTLISSSIKSQRVIGFLGDWHHWENPNYVSTGINYDKLTDVVLAFVIPKSDGSYTYEPEFESQLEEMVNQAHAKDRKVHISIGGYSASHNTDGSLISPDPMRQMTSNGTTRKKFVDAMIKMVKDYDLDGLNFDWEYPSSSDTYNLNQILYDLKLGLINLESELGKTLELSIAVSASGYYSSAYNSTSLSYVDFVYIMAFDNGGDHHSSLSFAISAMDFWLDSKNLEPKKIILAIPFYSKNNGEWNGYYKDFSKSDPSAYFNDEDGSLNNRNYNSKPVLEAKIHEINKRGGSGVFVWEIWGDRNDEYSLLNVLYSNLVGKKDLEKELGKINIYPNPVIDILNINTNKQNLLFRITDITGREIKNGKLIQGINHIKTESIDSKGIYFITISDGLTKVSHKIIKK